MRRLRAPAIAATVLCAVLPALATSAPVPRASLPTRATAPFPTTTAVTLLWPVRGDRDRDARVGVEYRRSGAGTWSRAMPLRRTPGGEAEGFRWPERHAGSVMGLTPGTRYEIRLRLRDPDGGSRTRVLRVRTRPIPAPMAGAPGRPATPATLRAVLGAARPGDIVTLGPGRYAAFTVDVNGTPGRPVVIRGTDGAVVEGEIGIFERRWVTLDRLAVEGRVRFNGTDHFTMTRSTVTARRDLEGHGIITNLRAANAYIADNTVLGTTAWTDAALGAEGANLGEGILVTGPGHVIEHNLVRGFRDGISLLEDDAARDQFSIDIAGNDIREAADDGVEADFCAHNCRVTGNRLTDTFVAMSSQPGLGGPGGTVGGYGNGSGRPLDIRTLVRPDMDFDAFGTSEAFTGVFGAVRFDGLAQLRSRTTERHAVRVDLGAFAAPVTAPSPLTRHAPQDLRPAPGAAVVDAGVVIPNVTDGFAGTRPDIGAHEAGAPPPAYGPRP